MVKYKIGDVISPKYKRHSHWGDRVIVGYDGDIGYLWSYIENEE